MSRDDEWAEDIDPQNIYDNERFFQGYKSLRQNDNGLNGALEIPALRLLLPDLSGLNVLDLGCGFGDFARFARARGAASVTAIDISVRMLEEAKMLTNDSAITYAHRAIEEYAPAADTFDVVVSSLALHYIRDYSKVVLAVHRALKPGGRFVFSVEHPMCTANPIGWVCDSDARPMYWPVDLYSQEGSRSTHWFVEGVVKWHRTTATYVTTLIRSGFSITHLDEPIPTREALAARPILQYDCRRPPFLLLSAAKLCC